ncbi:MAG: hypothetical protein ACTSP4_05335 [Candidatus Hodarchaeales archaeon]
MAGDLLIYQLISVMCSAIGFALIVSSFFYIRSTLAILKKAKIYKRWRIIQYLTIFFSFGYLGNIILVFFVDLPSLLLLQGFIYLFGAIFVLLVLSTANKTYKVIYDIAGEK